MGLSLWGNVVSRYYRLMYSSLPLDDKLRGLYGIIRENPGFYHAYVSASSIMAYEKWRFHTPFPEDSFPHLFLFFLYRKNLSLSVSHILPQITEAPPNPFILKELLAAGWKGSSPFPPEETRFISRLNSSFPSLKEAESFYRKYSPSKEPETSLFFVFWFLNSLLINRKASPCLPLILKWEEVSSFHYPFWFLRHYYFAISKNPQMRLLYILKAAREARTLYLTDLFHLYNRMVATSYGKIGDFNRALSHFSQTLNFYERFGKRKAQVDVLISRAYLFYENYIYQFALEDLRKALALMEGVSSYKRAYIFTLLSLTYIKLGELGKAKENARLGLREAKKYKFTAAYLASELALGRISLAEGNFRKALELGEELEKLGRKRGDMELVFSALTLKKEALIKLGNFSRAISELRKALHLSPTLRDRFKVNLEIYKLYERLQSDGWWAYIIYSLRAYPYIVRAKKLAEEIEEDRLPTKEMKYEFLKNKMEVFTRFGGASLKVARIITGFFVVIIALLFTGWRAARRKANLVGGYKLMREIGRGGMGRVYLARKIRDGGKIALKVMDGIEAPVEDMKGFLEEAELLKTLDHPNIVRFLGSGHEGSTFYIAMEYVRGRSLFQLSQNDPPPFPPETVREISLATASALSYLHSRMIVHRDIKPSNILIEGHFGSLRGVRKNNVKLTDFGIARKLAAYREATGTIAGTPHYIPPETLSQGVITPASDIYSSGVLLYWMVTGTLPFGHLDLSLLISRILTTEPVPPSVTVKISPCLEKIILRAMSKNPTERYPNGEEFYQALLGCYRG